MIHLKVEIKVSLFRDDSLAESQIGSVSSHSFVSSRGMVATAMAMI